MRVRIRKPGLWLLVLAPVVAAISLVIMSWPRLRANSLRDELLAMGAQAVITDGRPVWLQEWAGTLGSSFFGDVEELSFEPAALLCSKAELRSTLPRLKHFRGLQALYLYSGQAGDADLAVLRSLPGLRILGLGGAEIGDGALWHVAECRQLRELYLQGTSITDAGLRRLEPCYELRVLFLDGTAVTDEGVTWLSLRFPKLEELSVANTNVTQGGLEPLLRRLPDLQVTDD